MLKLTKRIIGMPIRFRKCSLFGTKSGPTAVDGKQASQEAEALDILAKYPTVRLRLSHNLPKNLLHSIPGADISDQSGNPFQVKSTILRVLLSKDNVTLRVLPDNITPPLISLEPSALLSHGSGDSKSKQLRLRTNIDDHMMGIKVRQASEFAAKGHEVTVVVRLPNKHLKQLFGSGALSEEEKVAIHKKFLESSVERFKGAFGPCSTKPPKFTTSKDLKEFTITISPNL